MENIYSVVGEMSLFSSHNFDNILSLSLYTNLHAAYLFTPSTWAYLFTPSTCHHQWLFSHSIPPPQPSWRWIFSLSSTKPNGIARKRVLLINLFFFHYSWSPFSHTISKQTNKDTLHLNKWMGILLNNLVGDHIFLLINTKM